MRKLLPRLSILATAIAFSSLHAESSEVGMLFGFDLPGLSSNTSTVVSGLNEAPAGSGAIPTTTTITVSSDASFAFLAYYEQSLGNTFALELGITPLARKFDQSFSTVDSASKTTTFADQTGTITTTSTYLAFPLLLRLNLSKNISVGGGFYVATGVGNVHNISTITGIPKFDQSFANQQVNATDNGFVLDGRVKFPLSSVPANIILDGRWYVGGNNYTTNGAATSATYTDMQFMAGMTLRLGEKIVTDTEAKDDRSDAKDSKDSK